MIEILIAFFGVQPNGRFGLREKLRVLGSKRGSGNDPARHSANDGNTKQAQWISRMSKLTATSRYIILQEIQPAGETCERQPACGSLSLCPIKPC